MVEESIDKDQNITCIWSLLRRHERCLEAPAAAVLGGREGATGGGIGKQ